jgi:hypothetical protein
MYCLFAGSASAELRPKDSHVVSEFTLQMASSRLRWWEMGYACCCEMLANAYGCGEMPFRTCCARYIQGSIAVGDFGNFSIQKMQSRRNLPPVGAIRIDPAMLNMNRLHIKIGERKFLKLSGISQDVLPNAVAFLEPFLTDSAGMCRMITHAPISSDDHDRNEYVYNFFPSCD